MHGMGRQEQNRSNDHHGQDRQPIADVGRAQLFRTDAVLPDPAPIAEEASACVLRVSYHGDRPRNMRPEFDSPASISPSSFDRSSFSLRTGSLLATSFMARSIGTWM